jgi:hypothetical protein
VSTAALHVPPDFRFDRHRCAEAQLQEINSCRNHLRMLAMLSPLLILAMSPRSSLPFDFIARRWTSAPRPVKSLEAH